MNYNRFLELAVKEAQKSIHKQRVGCVIFHKKEVLSTGHNYPQRSAKSLHPRFQRYPHSIHAEIDCILKAKTDLKGASLLVVRLNNQNQLRLAKPCTSCMSYIDHIGIKKLIYTTSNYPYLEERRVNECIE